MIEIRNYKHYDHALFCEDLKNIPWDILELEETANEAWLSFKDIFLQQRTNTHQLELGMFEEEMSPD